MIHSSSSSDYQPKLRSISLTGLFHFWNFLLQSLTNLVNIILQVLQFFRKNFIFALPFVLCFPCTVTHHDLEYPKFESFGRRDPEILIIGTFPRLHMETFRIGTFRSLDLETLRIEIFWHCDLETPRIEAFQQTSRKESFPHCDFETPSLQWKTNSNGYYWLFEWN